MTTRNRTHWANPTMSDPPAEPSSAHTMDANLSPFNTIFLIIIAGVIPLCAILTLVVWLIAWADCCGLSSVDREEEKCARSGSGRVWYGRARRGSWKYGRRMALSEPDLGFNFASTWSEGHRSWVEVRSVEEGGVMDR